MTGVPAIVGDGLCSHLSCLVVLLSKVRDPGQFLFREACLGLVRTVTEAGTPIRIVWCSGTLMRIVWCKPAEHTLLSVKPVVQTT